MLEKCSPQILQEHSQALGERADQYLLEHSSRILENCNAQILDGCFSQSWGQYISLTEAGGFTAFLHLSSGDVSLSPSGTRGVSWVEILPPIRQNCDTWERDRAKNWPRLALMVQAVKDCVKGPPPPVLQEGRKHGGREARSTLPQSSWAGGCCTRRISLPIAEFCVCLPALLLLSKVQLFRG